DGPTTHPTVEQPCASGAWVLSGGAQAKSARVKTSTTDGATAGGNAQNTVANVNVGLSQSLTARVFSLSPLRIGSRSEGKRVDDSVKDVRQFGLGEPGLVRDLIALAPIGPADVDDRYHSLVRVSSATHIEGAARNLLR